MGLCRLVLNPAPQASVRYSTIGDTVQYGNDEMQCKPNGWLGYHFNSLVYGEDHD